MTDACAVTDYCTLHQHLLTTGPGDWSVIPTQYVSQV